MAKGRKIIWTGQTASEPKAVGIAFEQWEHCSVPRGQPGHPSAIAVSPHMPALTGCLFQGFAFYCTVAIGVSEGPKPSCLPQVGSHCCCECPVDPAETEPSSVPGPAQLCPTPRLISVLLSSEETPENSRPPSLPQSLLLGTQTQDALWNNHIPSSLHRLYALLA